MESTSWIPHCHHPIQMWLIRANEAAGEFNAASAMSWRFPKKTNRCAAPKTAVFFCIAVNASLKYILRKNLVAILESIFPATSKVRKCTFFHPQFYFWKFTFSLQEQWCNVHNAIEAVPNGWRRFFGWIYIYMFCRKKMGGNWSIIFYAQLLVFFSLPSIRCWWNDAGEMYMFRKGRLLWTVRDMWTLFGRSSRTCFFFMCEALTHDISWQMAAASHKSYNNKKSTEKPLLSLSLFPLLFALRGELQIMDYPDYKLYSPGSLCSIYRITQIQHDETRIDIVYEIVVILLIAAMT